MKIVIVGGTGTLGNALVEALTGHELVVFSRDELKQQQMKAKWPGIRYVIGDIRDKMSLRPVVAGADVVFHVAALKHVDVLEQNPTEAIKTNVLGTINVAEACMEGGVRHVVFSSTDKAVTPINTYGMTKAISERYLLNLNAQQDRTRFSVFRWANVMGSRGSVVHTFAASLRESGEVKITDPRMTRFWLHINDAVRFMLDHYENASLTEVMIPRMKSSTVLELAEATRKAVGVDKMAVSFCGIRPGEKIHETMFSSHDYCLRSDTAERYTEDELVDLIRRSIAC